MSDQQNNDGNQQDGSDKTEEMSQAQQAGYGNVGGLDEQAQRDRTRDGSMASENAQQGGMNEGDTGVTGDTGGQMGQTTGSVASGTDALIEDGDKTSNLQSDMGDAPGSQSGASAGSGGTGQST